MIAQSMTMEPSPPFIVSRGELRFVVDPFVLAAFPAAPRGRAGVQDAVARDGEGEPAA